MESFLRTAIETLERQASVADSFHLPCPREDSCLQNEATQRQADVREEWIETWNIQPSESSWSPGLRVSSFDRSWSWHIIFLFLFKLFFVFGLQQFYCLRARRGSLLFAFPWVYCTHHICDLTLSSILGTSQLIYLQIFPLPSSLSPLCLVIHLRVNHFPMSHLSLIPFFLFSILLLLSRFQPVYFLLIQHPFL